MESGRVGWIGAFQIHIATILLCSCLHSGWQGNIQLICLLAAPYKHLPSCLVAVYHSLHFTAIKSARIHKKTSQNEKTALDDRAR